MLLLFLPGLLLILKCEHFLFIFCSVCCQSHGIFRFSFLFMINLRTRISTFCTTLAESHSLITVVIFLINIF
jgi:hypothetical protein